MIVISSILLLFYVSLILAYFIAWKKIPNFKINETIMHQTFSILVAMRNEEAVVANCLASITKQHFPSSAFELIIIDDYSTDQTSSKVTAFIRAHPHHNIRLLQMQNDPLKGRKKKAAITFGISQAKHKYIILTDADCVRGKNWLNTINSFINQTQSKMVYAPVLFKANTLFEKLQSLEFAGLVAIGGAAIESKNPNMCSASNLIFEKDVFYEVNGYAGSENIASGDDEYLLHKVFKKHPNNIHFLKHRDAIVTTAANTTIDELINQRKRWVSKSTKYDNIYITAILIAAYLFNLSILLNLLINTKIGLVFLGIKSLIEGIFLYDVLKFFKRKTYILFLPLAEPFHILYVLIIGIWANIGTYNWKGRDLT
jgi:cellulose synthase/poly-beta-1,6-N-acetylglucosamine synthase-like glycosyltransferase